MSGPMTDHLSEAALADLASGTASGLEEAHLAECAACRQRLEEAREGWRLAAAAADPEPSPLDGEAFRRGLQARLDGERRMRRERAVLAPLLAAAAALVLALTLQRRESALPVAARAVPLPAWTPLPALATDVGWAAVESLVRSSEDLGPAASCRDLDECLAGLDDAEREALVAALRGRFNGEEL